MQICCSSQFLYLSVYLMFLFDKICCRWQNKEVIPEGCLRMIIHCWFIPAIYFLFTVSDVDCMHEFVSNHCPIPMILIWSDTVQSVHLKSSSILCPIKRWHFVFGNNFAKPIFLLLARGTNLQQNVCRNFEHT